MTCPYENNNRLTRMPCSWHSHPDNDNIRICDVCQNHYRIDEVVATIPNLAWFVVLILVFFVIAKSGVVSSEENSPLNHDLNTPENTQIE